MKINEKKDHSIYAVQNLSPWKVLLSHLICGTGLASSFWLAIDVFSINLMENPAETLRLLWLIEGPVVILIYSFFRKDKNQSWYFKAVARGFLGLPVGAVVNALGAIALGAPVGTQYFLRTLDWSLLMSAFTFAPAASVYGSSWVDWHRIFAHTKPIGSIDYMICLPAHGAVIGAWFGAWPMPLDWERTWQEDDISWWLDSAAASHVCRNKEWFDEFEPVDDGSVLRMGDESMKPIVGKGLVKKFTSGKIVCLFDVLYVPKIRKNLVSSGLLNRMRYKQVMESDRYILSKCGVFVGFGYYCDRMFRLNVINKIATSSSSVFMTSTSKLENSMLWH